MNVLIFWTILDVKLYKVYEFCSEQNAEKEFRKEYPDQKLIDMIVTATEIKNTL